MGNLGRNRSFGRVKPVSGSRVNWGHPLSEGLVGCWLLNEKAGGMAIDLTQQYNLPLVNGAVYKKNGLDCKGADVGAFNTTVPLYLQLAKRFTILWRGIRYTGASDNARLFGVSHNNTDAAPYVCYEIAVQAITKNIQVNMNQDGFFQGLTTSSLVTNKESQIVFSSTSLSQAAYLNDTSIVTGSNPYTNIQYSATPAIGIGVYRNGILRDSASLCYMAAIWNRVLSQNEVVSLYGNPYQFIQGNRIRRYFFPSAVSSISSVRLERRMPRGSFRGIVRGAL